MGMVQEGRRRSSQAAGIHLAFWLWGRHPAPGSQTAADKARKTRSHLHHESQGHQYPWLTRYLQIHMQSTAHVICCDSISDSSNWCSCLYCDAYVKPCQDCCIYRLWRLQQALPRLTHERQVKYFCNEVRQLPSDTILPPSMIWLQCTLTDIREWLLDVSDGNVSNPKVCVYCLWCCTFKTKKPCCHCSLQSVILPQSVGILYI